MTVLLAGAGHAGDADPVIGTQPGSRADRELRSDHLVHRTVLVERTPVDPARLQDASIDWADLVPSEKADDEN